MVICKKARFRNDIVYNAAPVKRARIEEMISNCDLESRLRVKRVLGKYVMMRKVMRTF